MNLSPDLTALSAFRTYLDEHGYDSAGLTERLGRAQPPGPGDDQQMFDGSREITTANVLARLFLLGAPVDRSTVDEFIAAPIVEFCFTEGLLETEHDNVWASIVIIPVDDLLIASHALRKLGSESASEFVLPASTHSANFLRYLTLRDRVDSTLDLGCGCGIHALFAARHSDRVLATDISEEAVRFTAFNAMLNGLDNIEVFQGNLFDPVSARSFDLIISNPPFVISPSEAFVYRDNPMELDEFCRVLLQEAPAHLTTGGHLQMLCEWVELDGESLEERVSASISGCDAWVLRAPPVAPATYVEQRRADVKGGGTQTDTDDDWLSYLEQNRVRAIHPCVMTLRRRNGPNWLQFQNLSHDVQRDSGAAISAGIEAIDFLEACDEDDLLEAILMLADDLQAEQAGGDDANPIVYLRLDNGLSVEAEVDGAVAAFLNLFDGNRSVRECIDAFSAVVTADREALTRDLVAITKTFVSRAFLVPVDAQ